MNIQIGKIYKFVDRLDAENTFKVKVIGKRTSDRGFDWDTETLCNNKFSVPVYEEELRELTKLEQALL